ncbi:hypothetical protein [Amycolatopsis stemonae]
MDLHFWPLNQTSRSMMFEAIRSRLTRTGMTAVGTFGFPIEQAIKTLPYGATRLSQTAPALYQEYDRLASEVDLRVAISPAIIAASCTFPTGNHFILIPLATLVSATLLVQAAQKLRRSHELLANCYYQDYIDLPIVETVRDGIAALDETPQNDNEWLCALVITLENRGFYQEARTALDEIEDVTHEEAQKEMEAIFRKKNPDLADDWVAIINKRKEEARERTAPSSGSPATQTSQHRAS